jgi:tetratricopeptide (TPR) repeat protein
MLFIPILPRYKRIVAILALALVAYWPTLRLGFLWDDHVMIEGNPALREWSAKTLKHDFTTDVFDGQGDPYYRPAQTLLNRLDYTIWGLRPFGYHLTNWVGHALNAILVGELAMALGLGSFVAVLGGCLFAVHPIPVEQLMIIAGRAEIFGLTFVLLSLLLLLREETWAWALGWFAYVIALLFKESALITPLLVGSVYAYQHSPRARYWRLLPFFILALPYLALRQAAVGALLPHFGIGYILKFFTEAFAQVLLIYVRLILVPWDLHSHRLLPHLSHAWPLFLILLVALPVLLYRKGARLELWSFAWFILALLPKTPIMIYGGFMLDHWAYPASNGILLPLAYWYVRLWEGRATPWRYGLGLTYFPLLIGLALFVRLNVELRGTDEKMYRWALSFTTSHPIEYNLGVLLMQSGRAKEAIPYFEDVREAYPDDPKNLHALAIAYWQTGHTNAAIHMLQYVVRVCPTFPPAAQSLKKMQSLRTGGQTMLKEKRQ